MHKTVATPGYRYYVCNKKATAGASACASKAMREDQLDAVVLRGLLDRVLEPSRLKLLLAEVLDRSGEAEQRRRADYDRVRRERVGAEARLRRLLELIEEGLMSPLDPIFAEKLAAARSSIDALAETERSLDRQLGTRSPLIDDGAVERFGRMLREQILAGDTDLRRSYVRLLVSSVSVNDNEIMISGSTAALEAAAVNGNIAAAGAVRGFDREWCPREDSNLRPAV